MAIRHPRDRQPFAIRRMHTNHSLANERRSAGERSETARDLSWELAVRVTPTMVLRLQQRMQIVMQIVQRSCCTVQKRNGLEILCLVMVTLNFSPRCFQRRHNLIAEDLKQRARTIFLRWTSCAMGQPVRQVPQNKQMRSSHLRSSLQHRSMTAKLHTTKKLFPDHLLL